MPKVSLSIDNGVAEILIDRPDVHNAFDEEVIEQLSSAFDCSMGDRRTRAIVLSGRGKSFCAGADLGWMKRAAAYDEEKNVADARRLGHMLRTIADSPVPTIASVRGFALGGGAGLVAACDFAVAAKTATFGFSEVKLGIIPAVIAPHVVAKVGPAKARELFMLGERFDAKKALAWGLVTQVAATEKAHGAAVKAVIDQLRTSGPSAVAAAKDLVRAVWHHLGDGRTVDQETARRIAERRASDEGKEGIKAFLEKRKPAWHPEASR